MKIEVYTKAKELDDRWDNIALENEFLKKEFLSLLEISNPCEAKYYIVEDQSIFVVYEIKIDLLTYSNLSIKKKVKVIGIPISVSIEGFISKKEEHLKYVMKSLKGIILILNTKKYINGLSRGSTLSTFVMECPKDLSLYEKNLRSNYRKRISKIKTQDIEARYLQKSVFSKEHYKLYENMYNKSNAKLEKQKIDFFTEFDGSIIEFLKDNALCGFIQTKVIGETLYFIFGGIDYLKNSDGYLYLKMLYQVIEEGIKNKCKYINMGQTAEEAKMRFGCYEEKLYMYCYSNNKIINFLINKFIKTFSYKRYIKKHNIYKVDIRGEESEEYMGFLG